jgi:Skp family chaperone for outer membrane proteins
MQGALALAIFFFSTIGQAQDFSKIAVVDYNTILKEFANGLKHTG